MENLEDILSGRSTARADSKPIFFNLEKDVDRDTLSSFFSESKIQHVVDEYREQQLELFQVNNPTLVYSPDFTDQFQAYWKQFNGSVAFRHGVWVFFPWISTLVHILNEEDFFRVRTARNRYLVNEEEQKAFYDATIGIGGLSVGNSVALSLVLQGGARKLRLADHDNLALSNLNRIRAGVEFLGLPKVLMAARQIYSLNPYSEIEIFPEGITPDNIGSFCDGLDVLVDEIDTIGIKLLLREEARKRKLPIVMGADNGDNAIIDIERHDFDPQTPFFHGMIGEPTYEELIKLDKFGIGRVITQMLGPENITIRMQESLLAMGKTIVSWPQLGDAALLNGIGVAYCIRKITTHQSLEKERALLSLDDKLDAEFHTPEQEKKRRDASGEFKKMLGL